MSLTTAVQHAHAILTLFLELQEEGAGGRLIANLERDGGPSATDKTSPDEKRGWCLSLGFVLRDINRRFGPAASRVLTDRIGRALPFRVIARETGLREHVCERISDDAALYLTEQVQKRGLWDFVEQTGWRKFTPKPSFAIEHEDPMALLRVFDEMDLEALSLSPEYEAWLNAPGLRED